MVVLHSQLRHHHHALIPPFLPPPVFRTLKRCRAVRAPTPPSCAPLLHPPPAPPSYLQDLKALSGGERSYTTIAFLLALGHSAESPFRIMDEFDVFMVGGS